MTFCLIVMLTGQICEARRDVFRKFFSFLDFDARTVVAPVAIAQRVPTILVPQYRSPNPIIIPPQSKPIPQVI